MLFFGQSILFRTDHYRPPRLSHDYCCNLLHFGHTLFDRFSNYSFDAFANRHWISLVVLASNTSIFSINTNPATFSYTAAVALFNWQSIKVLIRNALQTTWVFFVPLIAFVLFVILNHGIAVGDRTNQTFGGLYPIQLFGFILVLWILLLTLHIANLPKIIQLLFNKPVWIPVLAILPGLCYR